MVFRFNILLNEVATIRFFNIVKHRYLLNKAVVVAIKNNVNKKKFDNVRGDIIKDKRFTDIELNIIEAGVTLANLIGFDYDPSEAYEEQTA